MFYNRFGLCFSGLILMAWACTTGSSVPDSDEDQPNQGADVELFRESATMFDESTIHSASIQLSPQNLDWLNANALDESYIDGSFTYDGEDIGNVGIRYKGSFGTLRRCFDHNGMRNGNCQKLSLKVKFSEYDDTQRFHGLKRINLHAKDGDSSRMGEAHYSSIFC